MIIQNEYRYTHPVLDWARQSSFGRGFGVYMLERVSVSMVENYIYWVRTRRYGVVWFKLGPVIVNIWVTVY